MRFSCLFPAVILLLLSTPVLPAEHREWRFRVLLDGREVGSQVYRLEQQDGQMRLETKAEFKVKILFVTMFSYLHENTEAWAGPCLDEIDSMTDSNGKNFQVRGSRENDFFVINDGEKSRKLPECVMTFAYWRPDFLEQDKLLNPQTGEYLQVQVSEPERDERLVRGEAVPSVKYRLTAGELDLQLWYSLDDEWLGLESKTKGNRTLKYELM